MTDDERARATAAYMEAHRDEWSAWLARPIVKLQADQAKVEAAIAAGGVLAARQVMRALGMPTVPDELCDPVEVLEERRAQEGDDGMRELARDAGLSEAEIDETLAKPMQTPRIDP